MSIPWLLRIVSGKQKGPLAALVQALLSGLTPFYRFGVWYRNRQFDSGARKTESVDAKVISIGNITTGGTGKTPMVIWVCSLFASHHIEHAIVSRGYGAKNSSLPNDEAMELKSRLPNVPHVQNPDRVKAANRCIKEHSASAIVLDDGFQHRRLGRDLDIVLVDASNPFGYGHLIPRGLLREPTSALDRADAVVITRCDRVEGSRVREIRNQIRNETAAPIALGQTLPTGLVQSDGVHTNLDALSHGKWFVFSAIGNHEAFESSVTESGCRVVGSHRFRDHHLFDENDHDLLTTKAHHCGADFLVCTHKDLVKIDAERIGLPVYALRTELVVFEGKEILTQRILQLFPSLETLE